MYDFFSLIWTIIWTSVSEWFMASDMSLFIYLGLITIVICYVSNIFREMRKF